MTDNNQPDGKAPAQVEPTSPGSASPSPASPAPSDGDVPTWFKQYTEQMDERLSSLDRTFKTAQGQSRQTENEFRKWMGEIEKLESRGLSREEAVTQLEQTQQQDAWRTGIEKQLADIASLLQSGGTAAGTAPMVTEVLSEYNLDPNDPRIANELKGKKFNNRTEIEALAGRLFREKASTPSPSGATSLSQTGSTGSGIPPEKADEMYAQLVELTKNASRNKPQIEQLVTELRAAGYTA